MKREPAIGPSAQLSISFFGASERNGVVVESENRQAVIFVSAMVVSSFRFKFVGNSWTQETFFYWEDFFGMAFFTIEKRAKLVQHRGARVDKLPLFPYNRG